MSKKRSYTFKKPDVRNFIEDFATKIGNIYKLQGLIFQGQGETYLVGFPDITLVTHTKDIEPTWNEWSEILRVSDDPVIFQPDNAKKPWVRKAEYVISGKVQQEVWARDGFICTYCGAKFGEVLMTIDHFVPLELGGMNDDSNYFSACRRCNKEKGAMTPEKWCRDMGLDFWSYERYLKHPELHSKYKFPIEFTLDRN